MRLRKIIGKSNLTMTRYYLSKTPVPIPFSLIPVGFGNRDCSDSLVIHADEAAAINWGCNSLLSFLVGPSEFDSCVYIGVWRSDLEFSRSIDGLPITHCKSSSSRFLTKEAVAAMGLNIRLETKLIAKWSISGEIVAAQRGMKKLEISAAYDFAKEVVAEN